MILKINPAGRFECRGSLKFDGETLSTFLETPVVLESGERYTAYTRFVVHIQTLRSLLPSSVF